MISSSLSRRKKKQTGSNWVDAEIGVR